MPEIVVTDVTAPEPPEVSDEELEAVIGGAYAPACTCINAGCTE